MILGIAQELDSLVLVGPFQHRIFYDSMLWSGNGTPLFSKSPKCVQVLANSLFLLSITSNWSLGLLFFKSVERSACFSPLTAKRGHIVMSVAACHEEL